MHQLEALLGAAAAAPAAAPLAPQDSRVLVATAVHERVSGVLFAAADDGRIRLSSGAWRSLESAHVTAVLHGRLLRSELGPVTALLQDACGVAPVLVKGPAVADRFYADPQMRPFADLDLLVPAARIGAAVAALEARGYERKPEPWPGYAERHGHEVSLDRAVGRRRVSTEVHWRISDDRAARGLDHAAVARGAVVLDVQGVRVLVPTPPLQLLLLAVHLLHEPHKRLGWLNDLAVIGRVLDEAHWSQAFSAADALGLSWVLHHALDHVERRLGFARVRPGVCGPPPPWGPLRAGERLGGWVGFQAGRLGPGGPQGYARAAAAARVRRLTSLYGGGT